MARWKILFKCIGQAVCAQGVRAVADLVPLGGVLYDVAANAWERLREEQNEEAIRELVEAVAQASPTEIREEARLVAGEVAEDQPAELREKLAGYLAQVPAAIRRSLKRPADPSGRSLPLAFSLRRPEDLLQLLPARLPRFQSGDRPAGMGDWELVDLLGVGGFGEVWLARHVYFDGITAALKFCLDPTARDRLLKHEATVLNQVMRHGRHPGIVPLLDASLSTDPPCLKYEYIEGGDLAGLVRDWQAESDQPRWRQASQVVVQLARIVGFAHRLTPPIVHRDLKPANVLMQRTPEGGYSLRITDFGIGAVAALPALKEASQGTTTRGGLLASALRGSHTPLYASPQQIRGEPADPRDDVHALGVIWYQLLTGDLQSGPPTGLWADELEEAGVTRGLIRLLGACVSPRPERRPADAAALAERLLEALAAPIEAAEVVPEPAPTPAEKPVAQEPEKPARKPVPAPTAEPEPVRPAREERLVTFLKNGQTGAIAWLLDLTNKHVGDAGAVALAGSLRLANLSVLILSGNQIGDEGITALAESPHIMNLERLILWDNRISDAGVAALAASRFLSHLHHLDLGSNRVGDEGIKALAESPHLANLGALILVSNQIGDAGAFALASSPYLANLAELKPLDNRITSAGVSALRDRFGKRVRIY